MRANKLTAMALLATAALILFVVEAQIPLPIPIPGIKLGLSNIVTLYALFTLGPGPALLILLTRVVLGSLVTGQLMALAYSLAGGLVCYAAMAVMARRVSTGQLWVCSIVGAIFHNLGQMAVAVLITQTPGVLAYLPFLMISGILTGAFTGLCAGFVLERLGGRR